MFVEVVYDDDLVEGMSFDGPKGVRFYSLIILKKQVPIQLELIYPLPTIFLRTTVGLLQLV